MQNKSSHSQYIKSRVLSPGNSRRSSGPELPSKRRESGVSNLTDKPHNNRTPIDPFELFSAKSFTEIQMTKRKSQNKINIDSLPSSPNSSEASLSDPESSVFIPDPNYTPQQEVGNAYLPVAQLSTTNKQASMKGFAPKNARKISSDYDESSLIRFNESSRHGDGSSRFPMRADSYFNQDFDSASLMAAAELSSRALLRQSTSVRSLKLVRIVNMVIKNIRNEKKIAIEQRLKEMEARSLDSPPKLDNNIQKSTFLLDDTSTNDEDERQKKILEKIIGFMKPKPSNLRRKAIFSIKFRQAGKISSDESHSFESFVSQKRGVNEIELEEESQIAHPKIKVDKLLVLQGKEFVYPTFVVPYASSFKIKWTILITILSIYQAIFYPYELSFINGGLQGGKFNAYYVVEIILAIIFIFDIILNMRTTFADSNNEEVVSTKMIALNYIKDGSFGMDLLAALPIPEVALIMCHSHWFYFKLYYCFRLIRVRKAFMLNAYISSEKYLTLMSFLKMFIGFGIVTHWITCIWHAIVMNGYRNSPGVYNKWTPPYFTTLGDEGVLNFYVNISNLERYSFCFFYILILMLGNDMMPQTQLQNYFSVIIVIGGSVGLGSIFGALAMLISKMNSQSNLYQSRVEELDNKLRSHKIPKDMKKKAFEYFNYCWLKNKIYSTAEDFSDLSLPLQRDLLFFKHKDLVLNVPLFKELEPMEILAIIQKLKTAIFMPGDKIIREGERGNEMFFLSEGIAEIIIRKMSSAPPPKDSSKKEGSTDLDISPTLPFQQTSIMRIHKKKGDFFGEIALIMNSRRTTDVNAVDFCILEIFSKSDYESLKVEFPDIMPRLKAGLQHYKNTHLSRIVSVVKKIEFFHDFTDAELDEIIMNYFDEIFIDPQKIILKPKYLVNAFYVIMLGAVKVFVDTEESRAYIHRLTSKPPEDDEDNNSRSFECFDDEVPLREEREGVLAEQNKTMSNISTLVYGEYFGGLDFRSGLTKSAHYYISESACQLAIMTQNLLQKMQAEKPGYYEKLRRNMANSTLRVFEEPGEDDDKISRLPTSKSLRSCNNIRLPTEENLMRDRSPNSEVELDPTSPGSMGKNDRNRIRRLEETILFQNKMLITMQEQLNTLCEVNGVAAAGNSKGYSASCPVIEGRSSITGHLVNKKISFASRFSQRGSSPMIDRRVFAIDEDHRNRSQVIFPHIAKRGYGDEKSQEPKDLSDNDTSSDSIDNKNSNNKSYLTARDIDIVEP